MLRISVFVQKYVLLGYENNTLIQVTSAVFSETDDLKAPAAVTGFRFNQQALYDLFQRYTNRTKFKVINSLVAEGFNILVF